SAAGDVAGHGGRGGPPRAAGRQAARARRTGVEAVRPPAPATGVARVAARREPPGAEVPTSIRAEECPVMMLYVVRHAIPEDAPAGGADAARRLTPDGRRKMAEVARGLRALRVAPDVVLTSPLVRAVETARIVVAALRDAPEPRELAGLASDVAPADTLKALRAFGRNRHVMIVGHAPELDNRLA